MLDIPTTVSYYKPWTLFWLTVLVAHIYFDVAIYKRLRLCFSGMGLRDLKRDKIGLILKLWIYEVFFQRQLYGLSHYRWIVHLLIFWGFVALSMLSITTFMVWLSGLLKIDGGLAHSILYGNGYPLIKLWGNGFGLTLLIGLLIALCRRFFIRPAQQSNEQMDLMLLVFLLWLTVSGFALEALRISLISPDLARYSFVSYLFAPMGRYSLYELSPVLTTLWILHSFSGVLLLVYIPHSKLMHSLIAPILIAVNAIQDHERRDKYWPEAKRYRAKR